MAWLKAAQQHTAMKICGEREREREREREKMSSNSLSLIPTVRPRMPKIRNNVFGSGQRETGKRMSLRR